MLRYLTDDAIAELPAPKSGLVIYRDKKIRGLGVRVLPTGTRSFVLDQSVNGKRRILTIGKYPEWKLKAAQQHASELKRRIANYRRRSKSTAALFDFVLSL